MLVRIENIGTAVIGDIAVGGSAWCPLSGNGVISIDLTAADVISGLHWQSAADSPVNDADFLAADTNFPLTKITVFNEHPRVGGYEIYNN